jgi:diguanylate cyclase (GGDEF)-like protein
MPERNYLTTRTLLSGKIVWNYGQSSIDCVVKNLSDAGGRLQVTSTQDLPDAFQLVIEGRRENRSCRIVWRSDDRVGVAFLGAHDDTAPAEEGSQELLRARLLALRASLDEVEVGVVLLDAELRAQFINKAFRRIWKLPDEKADSRVPFIALMYHGRDTRAYEIADATLDDYVAERVERVRAGDIAPRDIRLTNGNVLRFNCSVLPNGGRVLTYTPVTDIVRQADRLASLTNALDCLDDGVMLFDAGLRLEFINRRAVKMWSIPEELSRAGTSLEKIAEHTMLMFDFPSDEIEAFVTSRLSAIRAGDPAPVDIQTIDGKTIRAHCTKLGSGQRMLTYCDVTDLVQAAYRLKVLATTDPLTGLANRRHFLSVAEAEWNRFQRYARPLALLMIDIDHFKTVNDRYGHACGDHVLRAIANACRSGQRTSDAIGRLGGEEFAILLPETEQDAAMHVAERIRQSIEAEIRSFEQVYFRVTVSVGVATATASMSGFNALLRYADKALYEAKAAGRNRTATYAAPAIEQRWAAE